jgi:hypothetical protein
MSAQITRADLTKDFKSCHRIEDTIWAQLRMRKLTEESPAALVRSALQECTRPAWCAEEAWICIRDTMDAYAAAHGSLAVYHNARTMKGITLQRWLEQRRKKAERIDEAKYLFADMDTIGDEETFR